MTQGYGLRGQSLIEIRRHIDLQGHSMRCDVPDIVYRYSQRVRPCAVRLTRAERQNGIGQRDEGRWVRQTDGVGVAVRVRY